MANLTTSDTTRRHAVMLDRELADFYEEMVGGERENDINN